MNVQLDNAACKRTAILDSTLVLIKEHGFHGTPMSLIARSAGVAAGTIYHYFESKDALICELYIYVKEKMAEAVLKDFDEAKSYKDSFLDFWVNQCTFYIQNENYLYFLEQYLNSPYVKQSSENESNLFKTRLIPFFEKGIEQSLIRKIDYQLMGTVIHGSIVAAAKYHLLGHYDFTNERLYHTALIIWDGIKVQE